MDAAHFGRLWRGFMPARVILTANNLRVFDRLDKPSTVKSVSSRLGTDPRATEILLDALCSLGLLAKDGGRYSNTDASRRYLVSGSPDYMGDIVRHGQSLWENWSALDEVLMTGKPARRAADHESFILGMHNVSRHRVPELLRVVGLRGVNKALDLGGGPGTYAIAMALKGVDVTLFDRPETLAIARRLARKDGVKLRTMGGDFMAHGIGRGYDLILVSQVAHAYSEKENIKLLAKCHAALKPGGRVAIQEIIVGPERTNPPAAAIFAVNMLVNTVGGRTYHQEEIVTWLREAGFIRIKAKNTADTVVVTGRRRAG